MYHGNYRWIGVALVAMTALGVGLFPAEGQAPFNEREVKYQPSPLDKGDIWAMDFRFKEPRLIKVNYPGRGTRIFWYMWYQVVNNTKLPRDFSPTFELVTLDHPGLYTDEVLPYVVDTIRKIEDPTGYQEIKNSQSISNLPIPVSKPPEEAFPRAVTGVAIWDGSSADPKKRDPKTRDLSECTRFSIFVRGLSNGFVEVDPPAPGLPPITQYKTLQLNFQRKGDRYSVDSRDIQFVAPAQWIYRAEGRKIVPSAEEAKEKPGK